MAEGVKIGKQSKVNTGFDLPDKGYAVIQVEELNFIKEDAKVGADEKKKGVISAQLKGTIVDHENIGSIDGMTQHYFYGINDTKKGHQLEVLLNVMVFAGIALDTEKTYDFKYFEDEKKQTQAYRALAGKFIGTKITHKTTPKKDNKDETITNANCSEFMSRKDAEANIKKAKGGSADGTFKENGKSAPAEETDPFA
jgi:hypothetical protein